MSRPILLDLFCGAGGATRGYQDAGFTVVGVDNKPQPRYCGDYFTQMDAFKYLALEYYSGKYKAFSAIHASPPCQGYSPLRHLPWLKDKEYPLLIEPLREWLVKLGLPYVIENSSRAPLDGSVLCGLMFGLPLYRHRRFETNWPILHPAHPRHQVVIGHGRMVNDRRKGSLNNGSAIGAWGKQTIVTVAGGQYLKADGERAMGIDWMNRDELSEAIPPAFTKFIGAALMAHLRAEATA